MYDWIVDTFGFLGSFELRTWLVLALAVICILQSWKLAYHNRVVFPRVEATLKMMRSRMEELGEKRKHDALSNAEAAVEHLAETMDVLVNVMTRMLSMCRPDGDPEKIAQEAKEVVKDAASRAVKMAMNKVHEVTGMNANMTVLSSEDMDPETRAQLEAALREARKQQMDEAHQEQ